MPRVAVTGATGFIGSAIVSAARASGLDVMAFSRSAIDGVHRVDPTDEEALARHLRGTDVAVHAAGLAHVFGAQSRDEAAFFRANADTCRALAAAAVTARVPHVILLSSVAVYSQHSATAIDETAPCRPVSAYARSKRAGEERAIEIAQASGLALTILRLATVYGPGDRGNVARLMRQIDRGRFVWIGDGRNQKTLVHRADAARAVITVAAAPARGVAIYNVCAAPVRVRDIVDGLAQALGRQVPRVAVPATVARVAASALGRVGAGRSAQTMMKWLSDDVYACERLRAAFGFEPHIPLRDGLMHQVQAYRNSRRG